MAIICHDRTSRVAIVLLRRLLALHQRNQVLGRDRHLLTDRRRGLTGRDASHVAQRDDVGIFLVYQRLFVNHYPSVGRQLTFRPAQASLTHEIGS